MSWAITPEAVAATSSNLVKLSSWAELTIQNRDHATAESA
jgi:hypothetical protein